MKTVMILFATLCIITSCKHADKMAFVKQVLDNPDSIEVYLKDKSYSANFFLNNYSKSKVFESKQIKRAKYYCDKYGFDIWNFGEGYRDHSGILYYDIMVLSKIVAVNINFGWRSSGDKWDFIGINVEFLDTIPRNENLQK